MRGGERGANEYEYRETVVAAIVARGARAVVGVGGMAVGGLDPSASIHPQKLRLWV
jgi:hypothetical protein